ncbi:LysR family transcriptional regulator (plasmid) [Rhizobium sp. T1470]|uniref:LysR family transcriptional regulator n=1 Tax=unclassified Rhizobium TaxID=2613769 RepID=UPI001AAEA8EC|nr:LysR family transcriptional regulator [Rhizobium sp. T1473]MCA0804876.1 LysR family transcriptional regulator [Rhizobium sp. T1473]
MDRLEAMTILLAAVDTGSLSAASRQLRLPLTTVSRRVSELEEHLKIRLLLRGNRKLALTDAGRSYVALCRRIMEDIAEAERVAAGEFLTPRGELIISVSPAMGRVHVMPVVAEFLRAFPDIHMRVQMTYRNVNLLEENVDLALRVGKLPDSSMISTRVASIRQVLCASPSYLEMRGVPKTPTDLSSHECVTYDDLVLGSNWNFHSVGAPQIIPIPSRLVVNSGEAAVSAATAGAGIARVLSYQIDDLVNSGALVTLLEAYEPSAIPVSFVYPSQRQVPLKLRAFLDFSVPRLRERFGS